MAGIIEVKDQGKVRIYDADNSNYVDIVVPSTVSSNRTITLPDASFTVPQADTNTVYTHPNHSGEVTSTADGATVIADNIVDEANLKISNTPTNGYMLTAQSGNTGGLTWAAAPSSSDWVKLSSVEVSSNVASIEFISGTNGADFSSTYHQLVFAIDGLEMSGDNVRSRMVLGAGGAYRTDSNHYSEVGISLTGSGSISHPNQTAGSMRLTAGGPDVGDSGSSQNGTVTCYNFTHGNSRAMVISQACVNNTDSGGVGNNNIQLSTHCFEYTNGAVDRAKFFPDSGTITDGKIIMYGLKA